MLRYRIAEVLEARGWTRYRLAKETGLNITTVYRLAKPGARVERIEGRTLETVCAVLNVQPGDLLEWVPERGRKAR